MDFPSKLEPNASKEAHETTIKVWVPPSGKLRIKRLSFHINEVSLVRVLCLNVADSARL